MMTSISIKKVLVGIAATALLISPLFALAGALTDALNNAASGLESYPDSNAVKSAIANAKNAAEYCEKNSKETSKCRGALARAATRLAKLVDPYTKTQYRQPLTTKQKDSLTKEQAEEREKLKNAAQQALDALEAEIARLDAILAAKLAAQRAKTAEIEALNKSIEEKQAAGDQKQQYKAAPGDLKGAHDAIKDARDQESDADKKNKKVDANIGNADKKVTEAEKTNQGPPAQIVALKNAILFLKRALAATTNEALRGAIQNAIKVIEDAVKKLQEQKPVAKTTVQSRDISIKAIQGKLGSGKKKKEVVKITVSDVNLTVLPFQLKVSGTQNGKLVLLTIPVTEKNCKSQKGNGTNVTCIVVTRPSTKATQWIAAGNAQVNVVSKGKTVANIQLNNGVQQIDKGGLTGDGGGPLTSLPSGELAALEEAVYNNILAALQVVVDKASQSEHADSTNFDAQGYINRLKALKQKIQDAKKKGGSDLASKEAEEKAFIELANLVNAIYHEQWSGVGGRIGASSDFYISDTLDISPELKNLRNLLDRKVRIIIAQIYVQKIEEASKKEETTGKVGTNGKAGAKGEGETSAQGGGETSAADSGAAFTWRIVNGVAITTCSSEYHATCDGSTPTCVINTPTPNMTSSAAAPTCDPPTSCHVGTGNRASCD